MTPEEANTRLYEKMYAEQERFRERLLGLSPKEILDRAYEYVIREDILVSLEYNDLTGKQARALLQSRGPLGDVFRTWEKKETHHMEDIFNAVESRANAVIRSDYLKARSEVR